MKVLARPTCVFMLLLLAGCSTSTLRIAVPDHMYGDIHLQCKTISKGNVSAMIDERGNAFLDRCPPVGSRVILIRKGASSAVNNASWNATGDGYVTGITLHIDH